MEINPVSSPITVTILNFAQTIPQCIKSNYSRSAIVIQNLYAWLGKYLK